MRKFLVIALLIIVAIIVAIYTFVLGTIKLLIGGFSLGALVIIVLIVWLVWKIKD